MIYFDAGLTETCTTTTVSQPLKDKKLINHIVESHQVSDRETCEIKCFLHSSCVSYNLGQQLGDSRLCQFSDSHHILYPEDLTESHGFTYVALEVANWMFIAWFSSVVKEEVYLAPCKVIRESLGFLIPWCRLWIHLDPWY